MELDFFIDGVLYENPTNWDEINTSIEFDPVNQITTISHEADMSWDGGDVYSLLYDRYLDGQLCNLLSFEIKAPTLNNRTLFKGQISVSKCTFNERERTVRVPIIDDSFGARIENNKNAKVALDSSQSKNGVSISSSFETIFCFRPSDGATIALARRMYSVHEAFTFLVKWMTDDNISFRSNFFDPSLGNDGAYDYLCSGIDLRNGLSGGTGTEAPKFSFQQLFDVMRRLRNVGMGFETNSSGSPVVVIEEIDYFRSNTDTVLIEDVNQTELSFEQNILYTSIKVGSDDIIKPFDCSTQCNASNNVSYFGFEAEFYSLTGECNTGAELDLSISDPFIIDTNKVQEVVEFDQDTYDEKTFIIHVDPTNPANAEKSDPLGIGENWYNEAYTNKEILSRYQDYLTGTLSLFNLYSGQNLFLYEGNVPSGVLLPAQTPTYTRYPITAANGFPLNNLIYDPQNRIDTITERFTPVEEGVYKFKVGTNIDEFGSPPNGIQVLFFLIIEIYDSSSTLITSYQSDIRSYITGDPAAFEEWESDFIPMDANNFAVFTVEYAQVQNPAVNQAEIFFGGGAIEPDYFQCSESRVAVQDAQVNNGQKRQLAITTFEKEIPINEFLDFYQDTTQQIRVTSLDIDRTGYINNVTYNFVKGSAEMSIVSNG